MRVPRVPCTSTKTHHTGRRLAPCKFATGVEIAHYMQQEVMIEGVLHVSAAQAGSCMERFGDFADAPGPALPPLDAVLASEADMSSHTANPTKERVLNEAFCLATPPDNPAEGKSPLRQPQVLMRAASAANNTRASTTQPTRGSTTGPLQDGCETSGGRVQPAWSSSTSRLLAGEAEELLQLETVAYQSAQAMYTTEALQASAAIRRQRRRVLLRLLRNGRDMTNSTLSTLQATPPAQLLASIGSSIGSLASWDDELPSDNGSDRQQRCRD